MLPQCLNVPRWCWPACPATRWPVLNAYAWSRSRSDQGTTPVGAAHRLDGVRIMTLRCSASSPSSESSRHGVD
jgi:hypothetical protein